MSGAAVHAAVEGEKKPPAPAVVENNPAVGEDKKLAREEDRKPEGQAGGTHINFAKEQITSARSTLDGQQLQQLIKFDILEWWEMHSPKYPVLSRIARDVLAIQASTVASESSFSAGGRIISDHRNRLKSDTVEALICLQDWLNASDPKPTNKDVEEEEYLVFYQGSECLEETAVPHNQSTTSRSSPNCATGSVACRSQTE